MSLGKKPNSMFVSGKSVYMDLNEVIREHALHFLPAKSLLRFRGVCRDWKFMISTPFFAHNQSYSFRALSGFFSVNASGEKSSFIPLDRMAYGVPDPSLSFLPEPVEVMCSSNGLVCCRSRTDYQAYYICNPVTKQWKKLPKPENIHGPKASLVLIFEPTLLSFAADYQLICAFPSELDGTEFEIYSSAKGTWRTSGEIFFGDKKMKQNSGVYANGTVYWLTESGRMLAFDLKTERTQVMYGLGTLGVMNGKICRTAQHRLNVSVQVLSNAYTNTMEFMTSNARAWKTRTITLDSAVYTGVFNDTGVFTDTDAVVFASYGFLLLRGKDYLYLYNVQTKETKNLGAVAANTRFIPYVNSFVEI